MILFERGGADAPVPSGGQASLGTLRALVRVGCLAVLLAAAPSVASSQLIVGRVVDDITSAPLALTAVIMLDSEDATVRSAESDSVGWFVLRAPEPGNYRLFVDRLAYGEILSPELTVTADGSTEVEIRMVPTPIELEAVVVSADRRRVRLERQGFYRRRDLSVGTFLDADDIIDQRPEALTDLMRGIQGVRVVPDFRSGGYLLSSSRGVGGACPMRLVLDGVSVDLMGQSIDELVRPEEVMGIEVYPTAGGAGAPGQYRGREAFCGIIMIWTS